MKSNMMHNDKFDRLKTFITSILKVTSTYFLTSLSLLSLSLLSLSSSSSLSSSLSSLSSLSLKNPVYEFVMNKFASKFKFKNIKKSISENTLFTPKPLKPLKSSLSSSPTKRINILDAENIFNYDNLLEQAMFISKTLWNLSSIKLGLLRLKVNATRCRYYYYY